MTEWELARYLIDAKKCIDSFLFISDHVPELRNIDLRNKANEIRKTFYINLCIVLDKTFPKEKKNICKNELIARIYYERDKNSAHKDVDYKPRKYELWAEEIDDKKKEIEAVLNLCRINLPNIITLNYVPHDRELFRFVYSLTAEKEEEIKKIKHPGYNQPIPAGVETIVKKPFYDTEDLRDIGDKNKYCTILETGINQYEALQNRQDFCIKTNVLYHTEMWCTPNEENFLKIQKFKDNGFMDEFEVIHLEVLNDPIIKTRINRIMEQK